MQNQLYNFILRETKMITKLDTIHTLGIFLKRNTYKYTTTYRGPSCFLGIFSILRRDCYCLLTKKPIFNKEPCCCYFFTPINDIAVQ